MSSLPYALDRYGYKQASELAQFIQRRDQLSLSEIKERVAAATYHPPRKPSVPLTIGGITVQGPLADRYRSHVLSVLPEDSLDHFEPLPSWVMQHETMTKRRITPATYALWGVAWQPYARRIGLPVRDISGRLAGITGRVLDDKICHRCEVPFEVVFLGEGEKKKKRWRCPTCDGDRPIKYLHTRGFSREFYLFGEHCAVLGTRIILVEGHFDAIALRQWGYNACAVMGTYLAPLQVEKVLRWFPEAVVLPDLDQGGKIMAEVIPAALAPRIPCAVKFLPDEHDPDETTPEVIESVLGPPDFPLGQGMSLGAGPPEDDNPFLV